MKQFFSIVFSALLLVSCNNGNSKKQGEGMRIVSVSKQITEMVFALGEGNKLVARDLTSSYPDSAKLLPTVGYHRMLNAEGIISMQPDVVIHSNDIGPETVVAQLEKAGVNMKVFGGANSYDSAKLLLKDLANFFHVPERADSITKAMDTGMLQVKEAAKQFTDSPTVMIIHYGQANNVFFVMSGRKGAGDRMIEMAGGKPAAYDAKGARQISAESVAVANPDVIIATDFGFDKLGGAEKIKELPGVSLTNAAHNNRIYRFEEHDLVYFGPRSPENILKLMKLIHQTTNAPKQ